MFEKQFDVFWKKQCEEAEGQRLEMLKRDLTGTKKMLEKVLLPVFGTMDGLVLEHEIVSLSGVRLYADVFHPGLKLMFEEEHFVTHAEKIPRERFSFERMRARTAANYGLIYYPYSRDEIEKRADFCQRNLYEFIGRVGNLEGIGLLDLPVYEREVLRCAMLFNRPFLIVDVRNWLQLQQQASRNVIRELERKGFLQAFGGSEVRCYSFVLTDKVKALYLRRNR